MEETTAPNLHRRPQPSLSTNEIKEFLTRKGPMEGKCFATPLAQMEK